MADTNAESDSDDEEQVPKKLSGAYPGQLRQLANQAKREQDRLDQDLALTIKRTKFADYPENQPSYVCETCDMEFMYPSILVVHMRTHSGAKPYVCETCGKAFSSSSNLARHLRSHSGDKPYVCETCGNAFSESNGLSRHVRIHSKTKPYVCVTCGSAYTDPSSLAKHKKRKHSSE
jgi:uncharacterized Zn-finger protein